MTETAHPHLSMPCHSMPAQRALHEALIASISEMGEGMMIIENQRFSFVNQAICEMLGYTADELLGWPSFLPAFHPDARDNILAKHLRRIAGEAFEPHYETTLVDYQGGIIYVEISVAPLAYESTMGVVITVRDISERKRVQLELQSKNRALEQLKISLESKVSERTRDLENANRELTRLNQVKSDFISIVSHELRTPLTSIKSFAEIMLDDLGEHSYETQSRYLSIINSESDRLSRLISDILDLQKIDSGKIVWNDEMVNLVDITRDTMAIFASSYRENGIALTLDAESEYLMTEAEGDRIRQVISNLLSNALKFTEQGEVKVHLRKVISEHSQDPMIQIAVSDTGMGIPPEEQERIFDRFYQVDQSQRRRHEGAGLGLSICKDIIEHYQGRMRVDSAPGLGSTFYFSLPELHQPRKRLGEVLIELGMLTEEELNSALSRQSHQAALVI